MPVQEEPTRHLLSSNLDSPDESRRGKRKAPNYDDEDYTPSTNRKRKRWSARNAQSKPKRQRKVVGQVKGARLPINSEAESPKLPIPPSTTREENLDDIRSSEHAQSAADHFSVISHPLDNSPSVPQKSSSLLEKSREKKRIEKAKIAPLNQTSEKFDNDQGQCKEVQGTIPLFTRTGNTLQNGQNTSLPQAATKFEGTDVEPPSYVASTLNGSVPAEAIATHNISVDAATFEPPTQSQETPSSGLAAPELAQEVPMAQSPSHGIEIRYSIRYSTPTPRGLRSVKKHWPVQSLSDKSVQMVFEEVEHLTFTANIQRILFTLNLSRAESVFAIQRNDSRTFDAMKDGFGDDIGEDRHVNGKAKFTILLEPETSEAAVPMRAGNVGTTGTDAGIARIKI